MISSALMKVAEAAEEVTTAVSQAADATQTVDPSVIFPHLGIQFDHLYTGFNVFGIYIAWYGVIIAIGIIVAAVLVYNLARRTGQNADNYIDITIAVVIAAIIGARIYYVAFKWSDYKDNLGEIFNLRHGGLAIYGGIIAGVICAIVVCKIKKISFRQVLDTCVPGIVLGQAIGRWGNFMNKEAYGGFTDSLFAMQIKYTEANGVITDELVKNMVSYDGIKYIQVHPTFLYESVWCLIVFVLIMIFRKKAKYRGEVALWYFGGYALGRVWIEGLRTDQLVIGNTGIAVSQLLAFVIFFAALAVLVIMRIFMHREPEKYAYVNLTVPNWRELKFEKKSKKAKKEEATESDEKSEEAAEEGSETKSTESEKTDAKVDDEAGETTEIEITEVETAEATDLENTETGVKVETCETNESEITETGTAEKNN